MIAIPEQLEDSQLLTQLLRFDLDVFASRLEMADAPNPLPTRDAVRLLNLAEELSRSTSEKDKNRCLLICGLLWEHRREEWMALPQFVMNLLSRIGLAPSMQMVDAEYKRSGGKFQALGSLVAEATIEARSFEHEVLVLGRIPLVLSTFQRDVWHEMDSRARVGISAPTSAGKSFVLLYKALDILGKESGPVVYVVPTLSLIQQVTRDFRAGAARLEMLDVDVLQSYDRLATDSLRKRVYVVTQERALAALSQDEALHDASLVIIDEVQNVERAADEDEERAHTLFDVLLELVGKRNPRRAVISGPRLENIAQLTRQFFGADSRSVSQGLPPVVNVTYSFTSAGSGVAVRQYVAGRDTAIEIPVRYPAAAAKSVFGKKQYRPPLMDLLASMLQRIAPAEGTLIFSPTSGQATRTALAMAERGNWSGDGEGAEALRQYVDETVHPKYALGACLESGVGFHHGKMPHHIRAAIEQAFAAQEVKVLACTTTLMQGINLPAKNLIARNPNLFISGGARSPTLTAYEFANLRGRAGRLLKDFVGRAIILDESAFDQEEIDFAFPEKTVTAGYTERFERNRDQIIDSLRRGESLGDLGQNGDLVVYVRQAVFRYGRGALERLALAGIAISDEEYQDTRRQMANLEISIEICKSAPYWDPLLINDLYVANKSGAIPRLPNSPFAPAFEERLIGVLQSLREVVPYYFRRYVGEQNDGALRSIGSNARKWSAEIPLKDIITWGSDGASVGWEDIDRRIARINQDVVYSVPKLLKPLLAIQDTENPLLGMLEMGAYRPEVRRLVELGVPRETAIRIQRSTRLPDPAEGDQKLLAVAREAAAGLNYWEKEQVGAISPAV